MKEAIDIINKYIQYAYYNLDVAKHAFTLDQNKDTYARIRYFKGQIAGLEAVREELRKLAS